jgi:Recombination endonuclease VII
MEEKTCTCCGKPKPLAEFSLAVAGRAGRQSRCKACQAVYAKSRLAERMQVLICLHCEEEFPNPARNGPDRKFCSAQCKGKWWAEQRKQQRREVPPRPCKKCGNPVAHRMGIPVCADCRTDGRSRPYKRSVHVKSNYGLTKAEYDRLLAQQRGRCAVCRAKKPGGGRGDWRVDHDHVTGQIRGLLCNNCNSGIGFLQEDPDVIAAAARYVARHRQMELFRKAG